MADKPLRMIVIGGGIAGMACAHRMLDRLSILGRPCEIFIVEAGARLGGTIETFRRDGYLLEKGPDSFLSEKPRGMGLCQDLAIESLLLPTRAESRRTFIAQKNRMVPIPRGFHILAPTQPFEMLISPPLSLNGKCRMLKEFFIAAKPPADESLGSFVRRRFGQEMLERLAAPIINGIYGADPETLSMRATFPQFLQMEQNGSLLLQYLKGSATGPAAQASGARYSLMMSFKDGMQTLVTKLGEAMPQVRAYMNTSATTLQGLESGWKVTMSNHEELLTDAVCIALPAWAAADIVKDADPGLSQTLRQIQHVDSLSVYYALKKSAIGKPLDGSGILVPKPERKSFTACTLVHNKFAQRVPDGCALLRAFTGGKSAEALWGLSDGDIEKRIFGDLKGLLKIQGTPIFAQLFRYRKALPLYTTGHLDRLETIRRHLTAMPTLALAGNWRQGVGVPDCIDSGERAADQLVMDLCQV